MKKSRSTGKTKPAAKKQISEKGTARKKRSSFSMGKGMLSQAKAFTGKGEPESEEYYRTLTDNTPVMIWITRPDGGCTYLNKQWYDYTGQTSERALGFGWLSAVHPDDAIISERIFLNANYKQIPFSLVYRLRNSKGEYRWHMDSGLPKFDKEGRYEGFIGSVIDTHQSVLASKKIEETKQLYEAITQNTPDLIYAFDLNYCFTYANEALLAMWGTSWKDSIGKGLRQLGYEEWHAAMHEREIDQVIATKKSIRGTVSFPHAELGRRIYDYIFTPVLSKNNEVIAIAGTTRDISDIKKSEETVKESEAQLSFAIAAAELGVWDYDPRSNKFRANDRLKQWFGLEPKDEIDLSLAISVIAERERERVSDAIQKALQWGNKDYDIEYSIINPQTSEERIVRARGKAAFNDDKAAYRFNGTLQDITVQAQARKKIEASEKRFRNTFYNNMVPMAVWTVDGGIIDANDALLDMIGYRRNQLEAGKINWTEITPSEFAQRDIQAITEVLTKGSCTPYEKVFLHKDGYPVPILIGGGSFDDTGNSGLLFAIDLTERNRAEEKLRESEKQLKQITETIPQMVWVCSENGEVIYFNQQWYDYTGTLEKDMMGHQWTTLVHADDVADAVKKWNRSQETLTPVSVEYRLKSASGTYHWVLSKGVPILDEKGNLQKWFGACTFIDEQKQFSEMLEKNVEERTAELFDKNIELQKMNKELESLNYISSHDLQEPLRKIQTFSTRLMEKENPNLSAIGKDYFIRIQESAQRMQTLIQDLLSFSRINTSERKFELTDLRFLVEDVKSEYNESLVEKNATLEIGNLCELNIIPFQFRQLFQNLIGNALKFSKPDTQPRIEIASEIIKGSDQKDFKDKTLLSAITYCHITFTDNGIGFEQHFSEQIFQVFQKLHGRDKFPGTGIGLAIVKKIVDNHNGIIKASGELDQGARFDIYIPVS